MANAQQLKILEENGVQAWNAWRLEHADWEKADQHLVEQTGLEIGHEQWPWCVGFSSFVASIAQAVLDKEERTDYRGSIVGKTTPFLKVI